MSQLICEKCGKGYWPQQGWMHKDCVVVNSEQVVVNEPQQMVVNKRSRDRHKNGDARKRYMRDYMRRRRRAQHIS